MCAVGWVVRSNVHAVEEGDEVGECACFFACDGVLACGYVKVQVSCAWVVFLFFEDEVYSVFFVDN